MKFKRILLKLSGESLAKNDNNIDSENLLHFAEEIKSIYSEGVQIAVVIGGGNIYRGLQKNNNLIDRVQGDYMGMMATIINSLALQSTLSKINIKSKILSGIPITNLCEPMSRRKAIEYLEDGNVVIIGGGTGNPYFTTDTAGVLRAVEIKADVIIKGTRVDGIYSADPEKNKNAIKYDTLTFDEAYEKKLNIMDLTAFTLCRDNKLPLIVFDINKKGNLSKIILENHSKIGTLVQ